MKQTDLNLRHDFVYIFAIAILFTHWPTYLMYIEKRVTFTVTAKTFVYNVFIKHTMTLSSLSLKTFRCFINVVSSFGAQIEKI